MLADEGVYLASESVFSRMVKADGQLKHRGQAKAPRASRASTTNIATATRQVWCLGMTYLPFQVMRRWFYLNLILNLHNRKIVASEVQDADHADHAPGLVRCTALAGGGAATAHKPVLHGDNGSTLKVATVFAMLNWLGVKPSYSRPRVSGDNAFAEALFRTANYRPDFRPRAFWMTSGYGDGRLIAWGGTNSVSGIVAFVMSVRRSIMLAKTRKSSRPA